MKKNRVSALVFDLDGTAIPNSPDGMPSTKVIAAVTQVQQKISVSIATGRPITNAAHILETLKIIAPSIIAGGTQVYDPVKKEVLWEKTISQTTVSQIIELMKSYQYGIFISDSLELQQANDIEITQDERVVYLMNVNLTDTKTILEKLSLLSEISANKVKSYIDNCFDIHITHRQATKKYAMQELLKILKVPRREVLVVGDSDNDLPLFESAGLKIAMGNGSDNLKQQANYVTASVDDDGLAQAIDLFI